DRLAPLRFWRALRWEPFLRVRGRPQPGAADDPGRALVLSWLFRLLGGPAPFLIVWIATLAALPVILWTAFELVEAGWTAAAVVFLALVVTSPFLVETLSLRRSAVGFHIVALLVVVPLPAYGVAGAQPTRAAVLARAAAA